MMTPMNLAVLLLLMLAPQDARELARLRTDLSSKKEATWATAADMLTRHGAAGAEILATACLTSDCERDQQVLRCLGELGARASATVPVILANYFATPRWLEAGSFQVAGHELLARAALTSLSASKGPGERSGADLAHWESEVRHTQALMTVMQIGASGSHHLTDWLVHHSAVADIPEFGYAESWLLLAFMCTEDGATGLRHARLMLESSSPELICAGMHIASLGASPMSELKDLLAAQLDSESVSIRWRALEALRPMTIGRPSWATKVVALLDDANEMVRVQAALSSAVQGDEASAWSQILAGALKNGSKPARSAALACIPEFGVRHERILQELIILTDDLDPANRQGALLAFAAVASDDSRFRGLVIKLESDEDQNVRVAVRRILAQLAQ
jgi:hypothetical protein